MTTTPSGTLAVPTTSAPTLTAGVPCAARPGTSYRHLDGRCQCFFGGAAPVLVASYQHLAPTGPPSGRRTPSTPARDVRAGGGSKHGLHRGAGRGARPGGPSHPVDRLRGRREEAPQPS